MVKGFLGGESTLFINVMMAENGILNNSSCNKLARDWNVYNVLDIILPKYIRYVRSLKLNYTYFNI